MGTLLIKGSSRKLSSIRMCMKKKPGARNAKLHLDSTVREKQYFKCSHLAKVNQVQGTNLYETKLY